MERAWYAFMGDDPFNVLNYRRITVTPYYICGNKICAIKAADNGTHPAEPLSKNMQQYIKDALATGLLQPFDPYYVKKYVYLRD